jgi:hypothetical protein
MFFADGDFQSYNADPMVRGNTARICYSLARRGELRPESQKRNERILARTQHILTDTDNDEVEDIFDPENFNGAQWLQWNNLDEYDKISLEEWKFMPWENKRNALSVIGDVELSGSIISNEVKGVIIDPADPNSIHNILCQGVSEFKIQGWSESLQRWIPEVNPDDDPYGDLTDSPFYFDDSNEVPGVLYPWPPSGKVSINNLDNLGYQNPYPRKDINKEHFNSIPGLGKALKFTFTLYDSKGIIKKGRTFTHIVYLDD